MYRNFNTCLSKVEGVRFFTPQSLFSVFRNLSFALLYVSLLSQVVLAAERECIKCHQKIYNEIAGFTFQHSNFVQRECEMCHISRKRTTSSLAEYTEKKAGGYLSDSSEEKAHKRGDLRSRREVGIDSCMEKCHRQGASHPVGIASRGNIKIPTTLPTAEGNVMTCVTCHMPHGGKERYLARVDFKRDICVLCHLDKL